MKRARFVLLEQTTETNNARQAVYALSLLAEVPNYAMEKRLVKLVDSTLPEVRGKVYEIAKQRNIRSLYDNAVAELRSSRFGDDAPWFIPPSNTRCGYPPIHQTWQNGSSTTPISLWQEALCRR